MPFIYEVPCIDAIRLFHNKGEHRDLSGEIAWDQGSGIGIFLVVKWKAWLRSPTGKLQLQYEYTPKNGKRQSYFYNVSMRSLPGRKYRSFTRWFFFCPVQSIPSCKKWCYKMYLRFSGHFSCSECAKIKSTRYYPNRKYHVDRYSWLWKQPDKLIDLLSSKKIPMEEKLILSGVAQTAINDHQMKLKKLKKLKRQLKRLGFILGGHSDQHPLLKQSHQ